MFDKRKDAKVKPHENKQFTMPAVGHIAEPPSAHEPVAHEEAVRAQESLTLSTMCACGHTRRDHRGLRIEASGPCLECNCGEFTRVADAPESHEQMIDRLHAGLDRVERLQEIVAALGSQVSHEVLNREQYLALQRQFCGQEIVRSTDIEVGDSGDAVPLRIRHTRRATVVSLQRVELYLGAQHAMLITAIGDIPAERWRVLWKGTLHTLAHPDGKGADVSENGGGAER
jgi:hypothetical protein